MDSQSSELLSANQSPAFILFVAGDEPNSRMARDNLAKINDALFAGKLSLQIVDVFHSPEKALIHGVFLTPALIRTSPPCRTMLLGNLSMETEVRRYLGQTTV